MPLLIPAVQQAREQDALGDHGSDAFVFAPAEEEAPRHFDGIVSHFGQSLTDEPPVLELPAVQSARAARGCGNTAMETDSDGFVGTQQDWLL